MNRLPLHCLLLLPAWCTAAPAQLDAIWPAGGRKGTEVELVLTGKLDPWPCELRFSKEGFDFTPDPEKKGSGKLKISPQADIGPVVVRALNPEGASAPRIFVVDDLNELSEKDEDANTVSKAQDLDAAKLPLVVNGQLPRDKELDAFRLPLKKGETIHAAIEAYTIRSMIDPVLHVYDAAGHRLQLEHDGAVHLDPMMEFTAPANGDYVFAVTAFAHPPAASVYFRGGKNAQYRLYLVRDRKQIPKRLLPTDIGADAQTDVLGIGSNANGTLTKPNETDNYSVTARKDESFLVKIEAAQLGFSTDPVLRILKPDGAELKLVDDSNKENDPEYLWKVAADGDYRITVTDRFGRGGSEFRYRARIEKTKPSFTTTIEKSEYLLEPGRDLDIKVKLTRLHGHQDNLAFEISNLPSQIEFIAPEKIPEKDGDVVLKLKATDDAAPFQMPVTIEVFELDDEKRKKAHSQKAVFSFKDDNYRGPYAVMELPEVWLTIPPKKESKASEKKES